MNSRKIGLLSTVLMISITSASAHAKDLIIDINALLVGKTFTCGKVRIEGTRWVKNAEITFSKLEGKRVKIEASGTRLFGKALSTELTIDPWLVGASFQKITFYEIDTRLQTAFGEIDGARGIEIELGKHLDFLSIAVRDRGERFPYRKTRILCETPVEKVDPAFGDR